MLTREENKVITGRFWNPSTRRGHWTLQMTKKPRSLKWWHSQKSILSESNLEWGVSLVYGGPASCRNCQLHEEGNKYSKLMHSFVQHAFIKLGFESGLQSENIKMGRPGLSFKEMAGERRRKTVNRCTRCSESGCSAGLGRVQGTQGKLLWYKTGSHRHRLGSRKSWSAMGHDVLCHFKCQNVEVFILKVFLICFWNASQDDHKTLENHFKKDLLLKRWLFS